MINEPDVTGKTPVDYATEGKTPRCYTVEREVVYMYMYGEEIYTDERKHSASSSLEVVLTPTCSCAFLHKEIQHPVIRYTAKFFVVTKLEEDSIIMGG